MQSRAVAKDLAFVEHDLSVINADYSPQLVVEELLPTVFEIFREPDPIACRERNLLPLENAEFVSVVKWQLLFDAILSDHNNVLLTAKNFPLFAAFKTSFFDFAASSSLRNPVKLDDLAYGGGISRSLQILRTNRS